MSRVFFDHRWCAPHGIGRFATELRRRLNGLWDVPVGGSPTSPIDAIRLTRCLRREMATGWISPGFNVPLCSRLPVVTTIHDLIHVRYRRERSPLKEAYYRYVQRPVVRRSPLTLTVSEYSRRQIVEWYGVPEDRVVCVGNGVSEAFFQPFDAEPAEKPYFLFVGNDKPHKNLDVLLRVFARSTPKNAFDCKLVIRNSDRLRARLEQLAIADRVELISGVDDRQLAKLYRGATALVMPSHYEGFGLPLVEAMACRCPVIAANRTSIPEVVGDAAILFDPDDDEALQNAMQRLLDDEGQRTTLANRGVMRATNYRWDAVAERVSQALADVFPAAA